MAKPSEDESVHGCMRCGSANLDPMPGRVHSAQTFYGISTMSGFQLCNKCGYYGIPLIFDSEEIRKEYENKKQKRQ